MNEGGEPGANEVSMDISRGLRGVQQGEEINSEEVKDALKKVKNKLVGLDVIPYEFYKNRGECVVQKICALFNQIIRDGITPKCWAESKITLLHKGEYKHRKELKNYRPVPSCPYEYTGKDFFVR